MSIKDAFSKIFKRQKSINHYEKDIDINDFRSEREKEMEKQLQIKKIEMATERMKSSLRAGMGGGLGGGGGMSN